VTQKECMRRLSYDYIGEKHKYLMVLARDLVVDATRKGNYARFINHSCEPNCEVQMWVVDGVPRLGIFAKKEIEKNGELSLNYNFKRFGDEKIECYCGAPSCSRVLGKKEEVNTKKRKRSGKGEDVLIDPVDNTTMGTSMSLEAMKKYESSVISISFSQTGSLNKRAATALRDARVLLVRNVAKTAAAFREQLA